MKGKPGLGVLLLAALLGAICFWLSNTAADIFLLLAGESTGSKSRGSTVSAPRIKPYESRTYSFPSPSETRRPEGDFIEETPFNLTGAPTYAEDVGPNSTEIATEAYPTTTERYNASTEHLNTEWMSFTPTTVPNPIENTSDTGTGTGTIIPPLHTNSPQRSSFTKRSVTETTTAAMDTERSVCVRTSSLADAEILAIVIGVVFFTIVLSAILYQFVVFMRKKEANINSSIYIIENEQNKSDLEANGLQPETRL